MATEPATEEQAQPTRPEILDLKVVIHLHGDRASIGVHRPNTDPWICMVDDMDLEGALKQVPQLLAEATVHWQEQPRFPHYQRPTPPPAPPPVSPRRPCGSPARQEAQVERPRMF